METDTSNVPTDLLASVISSASQDVAEILSWRMISRSFKAGCMQVLEHKLEAKSPHGPGFDRVSYQTVRPVLLESSKSLKAALRFCPLLQTVQWQPLVSSTWGKRLSKSICALMASCCLHLTHLSLTFCTLPFAAMSVLGQSRSLQVLSLQHSHVLPYKFSSGSRMYGIEKAWQGFLQLRCLDISWTAGVASNNILLVAPRLLSLSVHGCDQVARPLCKHLRRCVCLDICGAGMRDTDLFHLIEDAPHLRHLYISDRYANVWSDPLWTDVGLSEFRRRRPDVLVRMNTTPLTPSEYERLGSIPSTADESGPLDAMSTLEL